MSAGPNVAFNAIRASLTVGRALTVFRTKEFLPLDWQPVVLYGLILGRILDSPLAVPMDVADRRLLSIVANG